MDTNAPTPREDSSIGANPSNDTPKSTSTNAFRMLMAKAPVVDPSLRDGCNRPTPVYNASYNPEKPPPVDLLPPYTPDIYGEPLFDDHPIQVANLAVGFSIAPAAKRPRTAWVWKLGYALQKNKTVYWACKHCIYPFQPSLFITEAFYLSRSPQSFLLSSQSLCIQLEHSQERREPSTRYTPAG